MTDYLHCPLCGFEFHKRDTPCANQCPLGRFCNLICCPNCGYEFVDQTRPGKWWRRLWHRPLPPLARPDSIPLADLDEGEHSELVCLNCTHQRRQNALAVYGLVPGSRVILQQKRPTFVIRVGETELALGPEVACQIFVKRLPQVPA
ncbi:MAG TPA: FeoA family protein [Verrucomicrobiae bacterium]|nr:FeoA family protein [Verrucomicrobiae bacterium]